MENQDGHVQWTVTVIRMPMASVVSIPHNISVVFNRRLINIDSTVDINLLLALYAQCITYLHLSEILGVLLFVLLLLPTPYDRKEKTDLNAGKELALL